jgi:hypothetical protein
MLSCSDSPSKWRFSFLQPLELLIDRSQQVSGFLKLVLSKKDIIKDILCFLAYMK